MVTKFAYCSDLHLEFSKSSVDIDVPTDTDILILAGDITVMESVRTDQSVHDRLVEFFTRLAWVPKIVWCMGNHEHYHGSVEATSDYIENYIKHQWWASNIEFDTFEHGGITIIVHTLWTELGGGCVGPEMAYLNNMADAKYIKYKGELLGPHRFKELHEQDLVNLKEDVAHAKGSIVIVTHHGPTFTNCSYRYIGSNTSHSFFSRLDSYLHELPPYVWVHGHTHTPAQCNIGKGSVVCCPRGYPGENPEAQVGSFVIL